MKCQKKLTFPLLILNQFHLNRRLHFGVYYKLCMLHHYHTLEHIYSFADNRWSSPVNNLYLTCGFKHVSTSQHGYWYTKDYMNREHRFNYNKGVLKKMGMDTDNHTEVELMRNMGYHRVWDCGVTRFEMVL
jgi:hypothetical protein